MGYREAYAAVKAARGDLTELLALPEALSAPPAEATPPDPAVVSAAEGLRDRCAMVLVRAWDDWYAGAPEVNVSRALHIHCERLARDGARPGAPTRRAGALLALAFAAIDDGGGDPWLLLEHVLPDLLVGDDDEGVPVRWLPALEATATRWRRARSLPASLARLERDRQKLWLEILRWEIDPRSSFTDARGRLDRRMDALGAILPARISGALESALERGMRAGFDAAQALAGFPSIRRAVVARGYRVERPEDLRAVPLEDLHDEAVSTMRWACGEAAALGAATGAVGLPGLVADLPALMTLNLRLIARMSMLYGFDVADPGERQFALNVLGASSTDGVAKAAYLTNINVLSVDLAHHKTRDEVGQHVLVALIRQLARVIAARLARRGFARAVPVLGGAVGAGANYAFTSQTARAAFMAFRKRWLIAHCL